MAELAEYIQNLREQYEPQPVDEEAVQKAEAYDYLINGEEDTDE